MIETHVQIYSIKLSHTYQLKREAAHHWVHISSSALPLSLLTVLLPVWPYNVLMPPLSTLYVADPLPPLLVHGIKVWQLVSCCLMYVWGASYKLFGIYFLCLFYGCECTLDNQCFSFDVMTANVHWPAKEDERCSKLSSLASNITALSTFVALHLGISVYWRLLANFRILWSLQSPNESPARS